MPPRRTPRRSPSPSPSPPPTRTPVVPVPTFRTLTAPSGSGAVALVRGSPSQPTSGAASSQSADFALNTVSQPTSAAALLQSADLAPEPTSQQIADQQTSANPSADLALVSEPSSDSRLISDQPASVNPVPSSADSDPDAQSQNASSDEGSGDDAGLLAQISAEEVENEDTPSTQTVVVSHSQNSNDKEEERLSANLRGNQPNPPGDESRSANPQSNHPTEIPPESGDGGFESPEIARLKAEILASTRRMEILQRKLRETMIPPSTKSPQILYTDDLPGDRENVTMNDSRSLVAGKQQHNVDFIGESNGQGDVQQKQDSPIILLSSGEDEDGNAPRKSKNTAAIPAAGRPDAPSKTLQGKAVPVPSVRGEKDKNKSASSANPNTALTSTMVVATAPNVGPGAGVCHTRAFDAAGALKRAKDTGCNVPVHTPRPKVSAAVVGTPSHDDHVSSLVKFWPHDDVVLALAQTMNDDGREDLQAAHEFLVQQRDARIARAVREESRWQEKEPVEEEDTIRADGELAAILGSAPGAITAVLHLVDMHKRMRNGHSAELGRTAANLLSHRQVHNSLHLKHLSHDLTGKIATAVVHDCHECESLRVKAKAAKDEAEQLKKAAEDKKVKEQKEKVAAEQRKQRAAAEKKEREEQEAKRRKQNPTPPLDELDFSDDERPDTQEDSDSDDFNSSESRWAKRRKAEVCARCGKGDLGGKMKDLYICEVCEKCFHKPCGSRWVKVTSSSAPRSGPSHKWSCRHCHKHLPQAWKLYNETEGEEEPPPKGGAAATPISHRDGAAAKPASAPPTPSSQQTTDSILSAIPPNGLLNSSLFSTGSQLSYKIDRYFEWKPTPSDWDLRKTHPECGLSEPAYKNWKTTNISRRDASGNPPTLGPLTNAITQDMYVSVGSALLNFDTFKKGRSAAEIAKWIRDDPEYKWVKQVSDQDLLRHLDLHFSILDHEPFLALKFPGPSQGYPTTTEDGDTNYFATSFSNFADKWLRSLKDLRQGGWDDSHRDLKQTFVNALESQPTLHREASTYKTESHDLLIAHLRSWCIVRENEVNKNAHTRAETAAARNGDKSPKSKTNSSEKSYERQIKALRTELTSLKQGGHVSDKPITARIPASVDTKTQWYCHGCGKTYTRDKYRGIPCERQCVYSDHEEHNKDYKKGKAWPIEKAPLTWGTIASYQEKYKKEMPAIGKRFIELRAKQISRKRERPAEKDDA